jgi:hypothetical protein
MVCCCRLTDALEAMKQVLVILSSHGWRFSSIVLPRARAENGQIATGILGALAGTILGVATAPRPYYAPASICVEPTPVYVELRCFWMPGS